MQNEPPRDDLPGIIETTGADAIEAAAGAERAAFADGVDPLANLAERVTTEGPAVAFAPAALDAAARQRDEDPEAFAVLRGALKRAKGFALTPWSKALDARARDRRAEDKARSQAEARARAEAMREARAAALAEARAATAAARAAAAADVAAHHAEHMVDDVLFSMEPGRITVERFTSNGGVQPRTLAAFSAVIVADVHELDAPTAAPRRSLDIAVMLPGDTSPRVVEGISAEEFEGMRWPLNRFGTLAVALDTGRRDDLRIAVQSMSSPAIVRRNGFNGWTMNQGEPVYLHASGAVGEHGPVAGLRAHAPAPVNAFDLGELAGADPLAGVGAVLELLAVEPADVVVPLVAAAFRAAMGPSRLTVHVSGRTSTGKSTLAGLVQALYGRSFRADSLPASWENASPGGLAALLAGAAALVTADEFRPSGGPGDARKVEAFDQATRAQHNGASAVKLHRDGSRRHDPPSRSVLLSTGEAPPRGHSTRNRIVCLELNERPSPDLTGLMRRAAEGELARGMASFLRWYAPRYVGNLPRLGELERAAADRWALGVTDRAASLFGALALGAEVLLAWLAESGVDAATVARHEARARSALGAVARAHGEGVEAENPARRFIPLLQDALTAGEAHIKALLPGGRTDAPANPEAWGWRTDGSDGPKQQGKCVGWIRGGEVFVDDDVALDVVRARAARAGDPIPSTAGALARDLHAAGLLVRTDLDKARSRYTCRQHVGGRQPDVLVFSLASFGVESSPDDDEPADAPASDPFDHPARG